MKKHVKGCSQDADASTAFKDLIILLVLLCLTEHPICKITVLISQKYCRPAIDKFTEQLSTKQKKGKKPLHSTRFIVLHKKEKNKEV